MQYCFAIQSAIVPLGLLEMQALGHFQARNDAHSAVTRPCSSNTGPSARAAHFNIVLILAL